MINEETKHTTRQSQQTMIMIRAFLLSVGNPSKSEVCCRQATSSAKESVVAVPNKALGMNSTLRCFHVAMCTKLQPGKRSQVGYTRTIVVPEYKCVHDSASWGPAPSKSYLVHNLFEDKLQFTIILA